MFYISITHKTGGMNSHKIMTQTQTTTLITALIKILRPLVRILLRNGMSYVTFANIAKWVFVETATKEFGITGKKQTISRISVLTGLSRKEVKRVKGKIHPTDGEPAERYNRAARVIAAWRREAQYTDKEGNPLDLPLTGDGPCFAKLVREFSGDLPFRAVLDELITTDSVVLTKNDYARLTRRSYVPGDDDNVKLHILGTDMALLAKTIDHNLQCSEKDRFFQRKVSYDNLPKEILPFFRDLSAKSAQHILENLDKWLAENDRDTNPEILGSGRHRSGMGIYYFEESLDEED